MNDEAYESYRPLTLKDVEEEIKFRDGHAEIKTKGLLWHLLIEHITNDSFGEITLKYVAHNTVQIPGTIAAEIYNDAVNTFMKMKTLSIDLNQ